MPECRCGVIGRNDRANVHGWSYQHVERGDLVACRDLVPDRRGRLAQEFGLKAYADAIVTCHGERLDLVHVVTPAGVGVEILDLLSRLGVPACIA